MTALLRPARDNDVAAIGRLHVASRNGAYAGFLSPAALNAVGPEAMGEYWAERYRWEREDHRLTVAVVAGEIAGFTYTGPTEQEGVGILHAIHVDPARQGSGIGRALMIDALADLTTRGTRAVLWVLEHNIRAREFYERGGWTFDGGRRDEPIGPELTLQLRYAKELDGST